MLGRARREVVNVSQHGVAHTIPRFLSSSVPVPSFFHHETTFDAVKTLGDAFSGPPFSDFKRRPVFQTITTTGDCLLRSSDQSSVSGTPRERNVAIDNVRHQDLNNSDILKRILWSMIRLRALDQTFKAAQRQGKLSFYLESYGEEASVVASAAALHAEDDIFSQYREHGALLWRGASFQSLAHQCVGTRDDSGKGRQMPIHYGDRARNFHTVSSPLATQIPHAVGFSYAKKLRSEKMVGKDARSIVACYFGDGTSSEGDFHTGLNFAATLKCPVIFICRNNGYAISTPTKEQYGGDGIVSRAEGYGLTSCRVDGGDARAVFAATREARRQVIETGRPILLELMTHRLGDHSTSDDRRNYVPESQLAHAERFGDPISRLALFLGVAEDEQAISHNQAIIEAREAIEVAYRTPRPDIQTMFDDIYDPISQEQSQELGRQRKSLIGGDGA